MACGASSRHNGMAEAWTVRSLLQWARDWLAEKGGGNPGPGPERLGGLVVVGRWRAEAAGMARANAEKHAPGRGGGARGDLSAVLRKKVLYDAIAATPPYVPTAEVGRLAPDVIQHEPHIALFAGEDGLAVIRRIVAGVGEWLAPGGLFVTEIDPSQGVAGRHLLGGAGRVAGRV